jgi:RHS repeat-associated protein
MAAKGKALSIVLAIVAIFASSPLFASIPRSTFLDPSAIDLLRVAPASDHAIEPEPSLPVFTSENLDQLAGVARIEFPEPSIADTLERRTSAMLSAYDDARTHRTFDANSAELASWPLASLEENNIKGERQLSLKLHRATEFQALPFSEPATGLVYARARWYDPGTGAFLTPDPMGYQDSSNLYAFCGGDPVNCSDPRGEARRTKNGGINWLGNLGDVVTVKGAGTAFLSGTLDFIGNTTSDLLGLDIVANAAIVAGDSSRSASERAVAGAKGIAVAALDIAGGSIVKAGGGLVAKVPGVTRIANAAKTSAVGRALRSDVQTLMKKELRYNNLTQELDDAARAINAPNAAARQSYTGRTTATVATDEGSRLAGGGVGNLSPASRKIAEEMGYVTTDLTNFQIKAIDRTMGIKLPPRADAEVTTLWGARRLLETPRAVAAHPWRICAGNCRPYLVEQGFELITPHTAYRFSPMHLNWLTRMPLGGAVPLSDE